MKELFVQKYLRGSKTLEDLAQEYQIEANVCESLGIASLNYSMIASDMSQMICQECRGLILELGTWNVASRSFFKFFNYGEPHAAPIVNVFDWDSIVVMEKVDGSLVEMFYYKDEWHVATKGLADASGGCGGFEMTFKDLILATMKEVGLSFNDLDPNKFYSFELTTPFNQVVVPHMEYGLTWLACWDKETLEEIPIWNLPDLPVPKVKRFALRTVEQIEEALSHISPQEGEGFVIMDKYLHRLKMKSPQYVMASRAVALSSTPRQRVDVLLSDNYDDIYALLPKTIQEAMDELKRKMDILVHSAAETYEQIKDKETQKDFALEAVKYSYKAWLFEMRKGKSLAEVIKASRSEHVMALLEQIH